MSSSSAPSVTGATASPPSAACAPSSSSTLSRSSSSSRSAETSSSSTAGRRRPRRSVHRCRPGDRGDGSAAAVASWHRLRVGFASAAALAGAAWQWSSPPWPERPLAVLAGAALCCRLDRLGLGGAALAAALARGGLAAASPGPSWRGLVAGVWRAPSPLPPGRCGLRRGGLAGRLGGDAGEHAAGRSGRCGLRSWRARSSRRSSRWRPWP